MNATDDNDWSGQPALAILADKEEDRFTVFLCELLRSPRVLRAFLDLCALAPSDDLSALVVRTQVSVPNGRPDLVISGPSTFLMFEAKVGSWLHDGQTTPYLEALSTWKGRIPNGTGQLILIAPDHACRELQAEVTANALGPAIVPVRSVAWEAIAARFSLLLGDIPPSNLRAALELFSTLVAVRMGESVRPFTREEVGSLSDLLVARAYHRLGTACTRMISRLDEDKKLGLRITASSSAQWQGCTVRTKDRWWWVGVWPEVWAQIGTTPIVLQTPGLDGHPARALAPDLPSTVVYRYRGQSRMALPLGLVADEPLESMIQRHSDLIKRVISAWPETGGRGSGPVDSKEAV